MAVSFTIERAEDPDTSNTTVYDIGSAFTPNANSILILCLSASDTAATFGVSTVTGGSLTWARAPGVTPQEYNDGTVFQDCDLWYALVGASPASTLPQVTYDESVTGCVGWVGEFAGHDPANPIVQAVAGVNASGTNTKSLTNPPDPNSMVVGMISITRNPPAWDASGDGWTEDCDNGHATPANGLFVAHKANDQSMTYTGTNGQHGVIMIEIAQAPIPELTMIRRA